MAPPSTVTVKALRVPLLVANAQGVSPAQILDPLGIDPSIQRYTHDERMMRENLSCLWP